ncbi:MAG TPA: sugar ABC transporter ATP-binding protein [Chthoniobacterales bacterium]|nr:sugar ABC transporter ATP-binding protein [Chthoniobacterales bacterium]
MPSLLKISGISKRFPGVQALQEVSFDVAEGSIHAVMGENGAGKSTLMQVIAGVHQPDSGTIEFGGQTVRFNNPAEAQAKGIAIVYQELNLAPNLSIAENIFLGIEPRRTLWFLDRTNLGARAEEAMVRLGLHFDPDRIVRTLTVAQQQLIEICKSLIRSPRLLILDEPTSSLSETESAILFRVIADLQNRGVTILYISHRLPEVFALCDTLTVLRDGHHVRTLRVQESNEAEVVRLMVGRELLEFHRTKAEKPNDVVLEVRNLTKKEQYQNVSFSLRRGEIVAMAGLIGAGRSETAMGIFGSPPPDHGELFLNGKKMNFREPKDALTAGIAFVPEDRKSMGLVLGASVATNISSANLRRLAIGPFVNRPVENALVDRYVNRLSVRTPTTEQRTGLLSGGNQQKVLLAKWLAVQPSVLIVDEPTRGVDIGTKAEIYTLFDQLVREGIGILVISSDLPEVLALADRILVMRHGRLAGELARAEATEERIMHLAALGSAETGYPADGDL